MYEAVWINICLQFMSDAVAIIVLYLWNEYISSDTDHFVSIQYQSLWNSQLMMKLGYFYSWWNVCETWWNIYVLKPFGTRMEKVWLLGSGADANASKILILEQ